jgi:CubicO group peptidase (beta-lactamase class C family)
VGVDVPVTGLCDERFSAVREAFVGNFSDGGEVGAGVCVIVDGDVMVDLIGGWADATATRRWQPDTMVNVYSAGKALVALLALQLVDAGHIGLDDPVASVWPEFGVGGKRAATLRQALCHQAGVPAIREPLTNDDLWNWNRMANALAATEAWWEPGTRHTYHTNTYGHLIGEIVRRITGEMPGARLRNIIDPLGADVWWGVPAAEQHRCADVIWAPPAGLGGAGSSNTAGRPDEATNGVTNEATMIRLGYINPPGYSSIGVVNTPQWRTAQVPSTNGHATATGLARVYSALLQPGRLLSPELLAEATRPQSEGYCPVLGEEATFGLGFKPTTVRRPFGPNPRGFGHFGTGGAVGFADPDAGVAFGYVMNDVIPRWQSSRNRALIEAVYRSL